MLLDSLMPHQDSSPPPPPSPFASKPVGMLPPSHYSSFNSNVPLAFIGLDDYSKIMRPVRNGWSIGKPCFM